MIFMKRIYVLALSLQLGVVAHATCQDDDPDPQTAQQPETPLPLEGDTSVAGELEDAYEERESVFGTVLGRWFDWKARVREATGFSFGVTGLWQYQRANESLTDEKDALGQWYRLSASWTLLGRNTSYPGRVEARFEYRSNVGGFLAPTELGRDIGVVALHPGFGYTPNFDFDLAVFNWTQMFFDEKLGVAAGRLGFDGYVDISPFQAFNRGFANRSFGLNPTLGPTGIGALGAVVKGDLSDQFWVGAHVYDANASSGDFNKNVFDQNEWLRAFEVGWTSSAERFATDRVLFTYWQKDERKEAGVPSGQGWLVSASGAVRN